MSHQGDKPLALNLGFAIYHLLKTSRDLVFSSDQWGTVESPVSSWVTVCLQWVSTCQLMKKKACDTVSKSSYFWTRYYNTMYIIVLFFRIEYIFFSSKRISRHLQALRYSLDFFSCSYIELRDRWCWKLFELWRRWDKHFEELRAYPETKGSGLGLSS